MIDKGLYSSADAWWIIKYEQASQSLFIWWQLKYFVFSPHTWGNDPFVLKLFEGMTLWVRKCPRLKDIQPLQRLFRRDEGIRESFHKMTRTFKDSKVVDFFGCFGIRFRWFRIYLGGGFKYFIFHPYLGKWSNLTNIFQMVWNHQPVIFGCLLLFSWCGLFVCPFLGRGVVASWVYDGLLVFLFCV